MIQRVQTIYLLLAAICIAAILFLPVGYQETASKTIVNIKMLDNLPTFILSILSALMALGTIFLFRNRKLQLKINSLVILLNILVIGSLALFDFVTGKDLITQPNYVPYVAGVFATVFAILAHRGISADEALVRDMDRLR